MTPVNAVLKDYLLVMGLTDAQADTALLLLQTPVFLDALRNPGTFNDDAVYADSIECSECSESEMRAHRRDCVKGALKRVLLPGYLERELDDAESEARVEHKLRSRPPPRPRQPEPKP